jgi:hypothetical protein
MWQYIAKVAITAAIVVAVSEIAKRSTLMAAILASLPLTSLLAFVWLYLDTGDTIRIGQLSMGVFWLVIPSLPLFLVLTLLLRNGYGFWSSLAAGCIVAAAAYLAMVWGLGRLGIRV